MYGLKWPEYDFLEFMWPNVEHHPNNEFDFSRTTVVSGHVFEDLLRSHDGPKIPSFWTSSLSGRGSDGKEQRTFPLYGPLGFKAPERLLQYGSVQLRVAGEQEEERERATAAGWDLIFMSTPTDPYRSNEEYWESHADRYLLRPRQSPNQSMMGPDYLELGIPGARKIITYPTFTHVLKSNLQGFDYSGVSFIYCI